VDHLDQEALLARITTAKQQVTVGATYAHYKHPTDQFYTVLDIALIEATNEPAVVYQAQYGAHITFVRPISVWLEMVVIDGGHVPRFAKI
jgi:hypothetical protein